MENEKLIKALLSCVKELEKYDGLHISSGSNSAAYKIACIELKNNNAIA